MAIDLNTLEKLQDLGLSFSEVDTLNDIVLNNIQKLELTMREGININDSYLNELYKLNLKLVKIKRMARQFKTYEDK
tara:strand:- start:259 stop:489 length:231 start_codon:yes stop_codon:yes gene_type:complete